MVGKSNCLQRLVRTMFKIGLIINPFAGVGGRVGLKGSDGEDIRTQALQLGGVKLALQKAENCLMQLKSRFSAIEIYTVSGEMGQDLCEKLNSQADLNFKVVYTAQEPSSETDTRNAAQILQKQNVDLLLFVGGDGTARDIYQSYDEEQIVLGVPAGVKIHSGVYAISAEAAGLLTLDLVNGKMLSVVSADVMDIDENAFRQGKVAAKNYGELLIPASLQYVQAVKQGNQEVEELVLDDIAAEIIESMDDDTYYVIGSGSTCAAIMQQLGLENTLLGSDIVYQESVFKTDAVEKDFIELANKDAKLKFIMTIIGGQGHILGRGNHQISPQVIRLVGWQNFQIIATKSKLGALNGRPLLVDSGDIQLDHQLKGTIKVTTGYRDQVVYPIGVK